MKKFVFLFILLYLTHYHVLAQSCLPEGIIFVNQNQIDSFQINYPNCTEIEGNVFIHGNLTNLNGLSVLTSIGGELAFIQTTSLLDLTGLNNLTSVGGKLTIHLNWDLTSLNGLENLSTINGRLTVMQNFDLTNIDGLQNLNSSSISDLIICENPLLSNCAVQSICNYLSSPNGTVIIYSNEDDCNNPPEIANSCEISLQCLPYGDYYFYTQEEIDNFHVDYQDCNEIQGNITIAKKNIANLNGLIGVVSISGNLFFASVDSLTSLSGLDSLHSVGGGFIVDGYLLSNLQGLNNLESIGGNLVIRSCNNLADLSALQNLTVVNGILAIDYNASLTTLNGIQNIDANLLTGLFIHSNPNLSTCEVQSICNYLEYSNDTIVIHSNTYGCDNPEEVKTACGNTGFLNKNIIYEHLLYPNPTDNLVHFSLSLDYTISNVNIYNPIGKKIMHFDMIENSIDVSLLPSGLYIIEFSQNTEILRGIIIKQ